VKLYVLGELALDLGALTQQLVVDKVAEKGTGGTAGLAHGVTGKIYYPDITTS
jgi:hypothetical protein